MELRYYFDMLRRRAVFIGVVVLVGLVAAWLITDRKPVYQAESLVYIGSSNLNFDSSEDSTGVNPQQLATVDRLLITFSQMIMSRTVAELATDELGIARSADAVVSQTKAFPDGLTQLLRIQVRDYDPALSASLANALAESFTENIRRFEGGGEEDLSTGELPSGLPAYVYELATIPSSPIDNGLTRNLMLGLAFSFLIGCAVVFLLEYLDLTVKNADDAERRIELPVLGVIPRFDGPYSPTLAAARGTEPVVHAGG